jgi:hypothetical protein
MDSLQLDGLLMFRIMASGGGQALPPRLVSQLSLVLGLLPQFSKVHFDPRAFIATN